MIAALSAAIQLWKTHASGTYGEWYLPFLIIGIFAAGARSAVPEPSLRTHEAVNPSTSAA